MPEGYDITTLSDEFLLDLAKLFQMSSRISDYSIHLANDNDSHHLVHWLALSLQAMKKELDYQTEGSWVKIVLDKLKGDVGKLNNDAKERARKLIEFHGKPVFYVSADYYIMHDKDMYYFKIDKSELEQLQSMIEELLEKEEFQ